MPMFREFGEKLGMAWSHHGLGETALGQGDIALATRHFKEATELFLDLGDRAGLAWCLAGLAGASAGDQPAHAAWLYGVADALRETIGAREPPAAGLTHQRIIGKIRHQLGATAFAAKLAEGKTASPQQVIDKIIDGRIGPGAG